MAVRSTIFGTYVCGVLTVSAVVARAQTPPQQEQQPRIARPVPVLNAPGYYAAPVQPTSDYRLQPGDGVSIRVFHEDDLGTTAHLGTDGTIPFPLLGTARIGGETVQQATATLEGLLKEYLVHPQVFMEIIEYSRQSFTILGQINRPGAVDLPHGANIDLLEAIGLAGGFTKLANQHRISVTRMEDGKQVLRWYDAEKMLKGNQSDFQVLPGDTVVVEETLF